MDNCAVLSKENDLENIDKNIIEHNSGVNFGPFPLYEFQKIKSDNFVTNENINVNQILLNIFKYIGKLVENY